jgi:signal peptidase I
MIDRQAGLPRGPELVAIARLWKTSGREIEARFSGDSMRPTIASGANLRVRCSEVAEVGDVLVFVDEAGQLVVHRVVGLLAEPWLALTWGDGNPLPDRPIVDRERIIGVVAGVETAAGFSPPPPGPARASRRLGTWLAMALLDREPRAGARAVGALIALRRWGTLAPRRALSRLRSAIRPDP